MVRDLQATPIRIRVGIHSGTPHLSGEGYLGADVNKGARSAASGHGGQVLVSKQTGELVDAELTDLSRAPGEVGGRRAVVIRCSNAAAESRKHAFVALRPHATV